MKTVDAKQLGVKRHCGITGIIHTNICDFLMKRGLYVLGEIHSGVLVKPNT